MLTPHHMLKQVPDVVLKKFNILKIKPKKMKIILNTYQNK